MKHILFFFILGLTVSCDTKIGQKIPVKSMPIEKEVKINLESEIEMLKNEVRGINEKRIMKDLNESEKIQFNNRIKELKKSLNRTLSLIRPSYSDDQRRELESSYSQTKEIWDYLIRNYKI